MPLALSTGALVAVVALGAVVLVVLILAPLRLWWRLRQGEDIEPAGTDSAAWRRKKKEKPEDYE